jgi:hypothetical protein
MSSGVASAGWFAGLGIGPSANVNGTSEVDSGGRSARLLGGMRWGKLAVEGSITGQTLRFLDNILGEFDTKELAIAGKYNFPLGSNFEVFAKAGLHRTWLSHEQDPAYDASGNGLLVGGGFEYRITTPAVSGSLFVDYTHYAADVTGDRYGYYGDGVGMWMLGFTVGL